DAVHYAPHGPIDVRELGTDFLVTSVYKWFGPHLGALFGRAEVLDLLPVYKVRPAHDRFETGTQNFEGIAGALAAVDYLRSVGARSGATPAASAGSDGSRRDELVGSMTAIAAYERDLSRRFLSEISGIPGLRVWGIADPARVAERTPTFALTFDTISPRAAAEALGRQGIYAWDGDFYAQGLIERLGLFAGGGVLRLGLVHYTTAAEVDRTIEAIGRIAAGATVRV
ncbi:MAG: aminotransferase class V-fold PLP-dependent enzyme, partial [Chloroflexota bacterium]|nr:aminotransferase class V-fold PLP-dependent enzyme [Chloroflexota bacterium]